MSCVLLVMSICHEMDAANDSLPPGAAADYAAAACEMQVTPPGTPPPTVVRDCRLRKRGERTIDRPMTVGKLSTGGRGVILCGR